MDLAYFGGCHRSNRNNLHIMLNLLVSERWEIVELVMETSASDGVPIFGDEECLKERKWWCFLLSSIFTFLLGIFSVLLGRLLQAALCKEVSLFGDVWYSCSYIIIKYKMWNRCFCMSLV